MFNFNNKPKVIDATAEIAKQRSGVDGAASSAELNTTPAQTLLNGKMLVGITLIFAVIMGGMAVYKGMDAKKIKSLQPGGAAQVTVRNTLPPLQQAPSAPANPAPELAVNNPVQHEVHQEVGPSAQELLRQRRLLADLKDNRFSNTSAEPLLASPPPPVEPQAPQNSELQSKMQPLRLEASTAGLLGDRNTLLTQGAMIDCVLQTRMITTQPGMTACSITRDIYSANGRVVLLDRGSKVIGHYQGGMVQGQARIFVLWSRIETPQGVIVHLDSPGTGPLGEGGVGGTIDSHFWERFGSAILLSLVDDFAALATQTQNKNGDTHQTQVNMANTQQRAQDMAAEALKNSINIPPTLYKNQGERIAIFVARDLDFGRVYALQHRADR